mmetsp:Transcript_24699/g.79501  ORF Transcript_24699/g.79501 Transcript_24699/m.79501 type:complete len:220 (+) Transcript_24699:360-1019(+)
MMQNPGCRCHPCSPRRYSSFCSAHRLCIARLCSADIAAAALCRSERTLSCAMCVARWHCIVRKVPRTALDTCMSMMQSRQTDWQAPVQVSPRLTVRPVSRINASQAHLRKRTPLMRCETWHGCASCASSARSCVRSIFANQWCWWQCGAPLCAPSRAPVLPSCWRRRFQTRGGVTCPFHGANGCIAAPANAPRPVEGTAESVLWWAAQVGLLACRSTGA